MFTVFVLNVFWRARYLRMLLALWTTKKSWLIHCHWGGDFWTASNSYRLYWSSSSEGCLASHIVVVVSSKFFGFPPLLKKQKSSNDLSLYLHRTINEVNQAAPVIEWYPLSPMVEATKVGLLDWMRVRMYYLAQETTKVGSPYIPGIFLCI